MIDLAAPSAVAEPAPPPLPFEVEHRSGVGPVVVGGLLVCALAAALIVVLPGKGAILAVGLVVGAPVLAGAAFLLHRRPWLAAWGAVVLFSTTSELRLRVNPAVGVLKDLYVGLLVVLVVLWVRRQPSALRRLRPLAFPLAALAVLVAMYLLDPAGSHGTSWLFGTRLLVQVLALLMVGVLLAPARTLEHLVAAMCVVLPFEAAFAWIQQLAGPAALIYQWGYQYGAQVRSTSTGGVRTSGTFEDPFQLAALAVLGLALALFVARRRQAVVLIVSGLAVLGATSVRTALVQVGLLLVIWAVRRGWAREAAALAAVAAVAGVLILATTTSSLYPGAPEEPLLFSLNGRSTSWSLAVDGWQSLVTGNGVGARGTGSTRTSTGVSGPPRYDPTAAPTPAFAGNPAFLDSSYAQVQSDVGIVGSVALLAALAGTAAFVVRRCRDRTDGAAWAAGGVLAISLVDWIGRSSLASYTTGFLTLYILGVLLGATRTQERTP
ncbi:MAG: hypothetical protein ACXVXV_07985 [Blastococcus sp.]